jgi:hypothetical protein
MNKDKIIEKPEIKVKIKGDSGIYTVWGIDWLNHKMLIERACGYERISFDKLKIIKSALESEPGQSELCPICKTTYLSNRVCLTCTKKLCSPLSIPPKELFEKVYIRDEKDLPKEGEYWVKKKNKTDDYLIKWAIRDFPPINANAPSGGLCLELAFWQE